MSDVVIYEDGNVELKATVEQGSVWLIQKQLTELFETTCKNFIQAQRIL